jgi:hypothetical protein
MTGQSDTGEVVGTGRRYRGDGGRGFENRTQQLNKALGCDLVCGPEQRAAAEWSWCFGVAKVPAAKVS